MIISLGFAAFQEANGAGISYSCGEFLFRTGGVASRGTESPKVRSLCDLNLLPLCGSSAFIASLLSRKKRHIELHDKL